MRAKNPPVTTETSERAVNAPLGLYIMVPGCSLEISIRRCERVAFPVS